MSRGSDTGDEADGGGIQDQQKVSDQRSESGIYEISSGTMSCRKCFVLLFNDGCRSPLVCSPWEYEM